jgi:hypothetical protein
MKEGETAPAEGCYKSCKAIRRNIFYWMQDNVVRTASAFPSHYPLTGQVGYTSFHWPFRAPAKYTQKNAFIWTLTFFFPKSRPIRAQAKAPGNGDQHPASLQDNKRPVMYQK